MTLGLKSRVNAFLRCEDGVVTVDFVVLTAAIIGLCLGIVLPLLGGAMGWGTIIADGIDAVQIGSP